MKFGSQSSLVLPEEEAEPELLNVPDFISRPGFFLLLSDWDYFLISPLKYTGDQDKKYTDELSMTMEGDGGGVGHLR